ncbi:integrase/recombinase xerD homolog [Pelobates fuscus]|uniref:integrase/recombinase xerD homolog n=1 Tax=Pelobates fuscus TaxID=191477 RepID=UPI002FE4B26C
MEVTTLVSSIIGNVDRFPTTVAGHSLPLNQPRGNESRTGQPRPTATDGMAHFRRSWNLEEVSQTTLSLLAESWAPGTRRAYGSAWRKWSDWCMGQSMDPISASTEAVLQFLTLLFEAGKAFRTINLYRSAISAGHMGLDGTPIGKHALICRLLKGIRLTRPPQTRYSSFWDVNVMLRLIESWPMNQELSLKQLSAKLLMLFCLLSCKRVADVRALDWHARVFTPNEVSFNISRRTKSSTKEASYPALPDNPNLCPVLCLKEYEHRTASLRPGQIHPLFISFKRPHLPVSTATLARWIKWLLSMAGIDTSIFSAHSVRGAMASKASMLGCKLEDILRAADWSNESTFRNFYLRPVQHISNTVVAQL